MSLTWKVFPNCVLEPRAWASIVSVVSRANPATVHMAKIAPVAILLFSRLDRMFIISSALFRYWSLRGLPSLHQLDFARPPGFVQPRFQWPIHTQDHKPAFARNGLQPVVLFARRRFRREIDVE